MNLHRLPGTRGTFTAKTAKKTRMFAYQVNGSESDIQQYLSAKEAEGYAAVIDDTFGPLYFTSRNLGIEATLDVIIDRNTGNPVILASNPKIKDAEEKRGILSDATVDRLLLEALESGSYAKPRVFQDLNNRIDGDDEAMLQS